MRTQFLKLPLTCLFLALSAIAQAELTEDQLKEKLTASTVFISFEGNDGNNGFGTGWILSNKERKIVTAYHVVDKATKIYVTFPRKNPSGWINSFPELSQNSQRIPASLVLANRDLDFAMLQVPSMPKDVPELLLEMSTLGPGKKLYTVGHPQTAKDLFHFEPGKVDYSGFSAFRSQVNRGDLRIRAEVICFTAKNLNKGASGSALINSSGNVVGLFIGMLNEQDGHRIAVSVREIQSLLGTDSINPTSKPKSFVGRWICQLNDAPGQFGMELSDQRISLMVPGGKMAGTYRVTGKNLQMKIDGKTETLKIEWTGNDEFKATSSDFSATCSRHDGGWKL